MSLWIMSFPGEIMDLYAEGAAVKNDLRTYS